MAFLCRLSGGATHLCRLALVCFLGLSVGLRLCWRNVAALMARIYRTSAWARYRVAARLGPELETRIAAAVAADAVGTAKRGRTPGSARKSHGSPICNVPSLAVAPSTNGPFMAYSTCSARDFFHPEFRSLVRGNGQPAGLSPKSLGVGVLIYDNALRTEAVGPSMRALGFAVGSEPLPAAFAQAGRARHRHRRALQEIRRRPRMAEGWIACGQR